MVKPLTYPVSELFDSIQGEGVYAGQRQFFIRLAGCSVGKRFPEERYQMGTAFKDPLPIYTTECTTFDGRKFECDTDYRIKEHLEIPEIMDRMPKDVETVCITGGEPFIHDLTPLVYHLWQEKIKVHIETSGTVKLEKAFPDNSNHRNFVESHTWITVSPKLGVLDEMLKRANEIKLLVDGSFPTKHELIKKLSTHKNVFLQPINFENAINQHNLKICMDMLKSFPDWRLSIQLHKVLGVR